MIGIRVKAKKAKKYGNMNKLEVSLDFQFDVVGNRLPSYILKISGGYKRLPTFIHLPLTKDYFFIANVDFAAASSSAFLGSFLPCNALANSLQMLSEIGPQFNTLGAN